MNKIKKLIAFISILVMSIMLIPVNYAKADETAKISISSVSGTVGDKVTVTLTVSASDSIDAAAIPVSYDNSIIKPVSSGNSGVVSFALLDASAYGSTESISMQFEIIAAGTTTLKVAGDAKISVMVKERRLAVLQEQSQQKLQQVILQIMRLNLYR